MKKSLLFILFIVCFGIGTNAQIIHIPSDHSTIQAGIDAALNGDTVLVAEGTWFENINFKGKAITVASHFILDGDTSHISKTIIDGSQSTNPDSASTVMMVSGEDTTSVLMGFTITGGTGTHIDYISGLGEMRSGGGVFIKGCGGKITNNIIEKNQVKNTLDNCNHNGGGIYALVYNNHTLIIRKNIIRNNEITGILWVCGGGIAAYGGRIVCEYNEITNNSIFGTSGSCGGGIRTGFFDLIDGVKYFEGIIHESIIRNNVISGNISNSEIQMYGGGGYCQLYGYNEDSILIYNNIIDSNHTNTLGGGILIADYSQGRFFNNTIVDNTAEWDGNNMSVFWASDVAFYNNIIWSRLSSDKSGFNISGNEKMLLFNNIMGESLEDQEGLIALNNFYTEPIFQEGSYKLAENSPGIGWAIDTAQVDTTWYYAPTYDLCGNPRPHHIDEWGDLGAIESEFIRPANANIYHIGLWDRKLWPEVHRDTLNYVLPVPDTTIVTPQLEVITEDWEAEVDINNATDISSEDPADRTTTITVTSFDGTTQKTYSVLFRYAHKDAKLDTLIIHKGTLVPAFHSDSLAYTVCLPRLEVETPSVICETTDPYASVLIAYAKDIQSLNLLWRTTTITVKAEDGINTREYKIEHIIDKYSIPSITLASDTVILNENIEVFSTEDGDVYLVPVNTQRNLDSIKVHMIDSVRVEAGMAAFLEAPDCGIYWLYAIDNCLNVSVAVPIICDGLRRITASPVSIYPNPVDRILYIETSQTVSSVEVFNLIGVKIMDKSKPEGLIDMSQLEQGMYFIRIRTDRGGVYTGKVMKK
jgi:hypothetical protein